MRPPSVRYGPLIRRRSRTSSQFSVPFELCVGGAACLRLGRAGRLRAAVTVAAAWAGARVVAIATDDRSSGWVGLAYGLGRIAPALRSPLLAAAGLVVARGERAQRTRLLGPLVALGVALLAVQGVERRRPRADATGALVALVVNRDAGSARLVRRARRALRRDASLAVERVVGASEVETALADAVSALAGHDRARLAVAGGDGTLGLAARVLAGTGIALCVLPCGTGNDLARSLGVPLCPEEAAAVAICGQVRAMDLVATELGTFAHAAGVGIVAGFADAVADVKGWRRPLLYPLRAWQAWRDRQPLDLVVEVDGEPFSPPGPLLEVALVNAPRLGGRIGLSHETARPDDGRLEVVGVSRSAGRAALATLAHYLRAGEAAPPAHALVRSGAKVRIGGARAFPVSLDGEAAGETLELTARVLPGACTVVVPVRRRRRGR